MIIQNSITTQIAIETPNITKIKLTLKRNLIIKWISDRKQNNEIISSIISIMILIIFLIILLSCFFNVDTWFTITLGHKFRCKPHFWRSNFLLCSRAKSTCMFMWHLSLKTFEGQLLAPWRARWADHVNGASLRYEDAQLLWTHRLR